MTSKIRSIHDAIDVLAGRSTSGLECAKFKETEAIRLSVEKELGIDELRTNYRRFFGSEMPIYSGNSEKGIYHTTLTKRIAPVMEACNRKREAIRSAVENAHIAVVSGEKEQILNSFRIELDSIYGDKE